MKDEYNTPICTASPSTPVTALCGAYPGMRVELILYQDVGSQMEDYAYYWYDLNRWSSKNGFDSSHYHMIGSNFFDDRPNGEFTLKNQCYKHGTYAKDFNSSEFPLGQMSRAPVVQDTNGGDYPQTSLLAISNSLFDPRLIYYPISDNIEHQHVLPVFIIITRSPSHVPDNDTSHDRPPIRYQRQIRREVQLRSQGLSLLPSVLLQTTNYTTDRLGEKPLIDPDTIEQCDATTKDPLPMFVGYLLAVYGVVPVVFVDDVKGQNDSAVDFWKGMFATWGLQDYSYLIQSMGTPSSPNIYNAMNYIMTQICTPPFRVPLWQIYCILMFVYIGIILIVGTIATTKRHPRSEYPSSTPAPKLEISVVQPQLTLEALFAQQQTEEHERAKRTSIDRQFRHRPVFHMLFGYPGDVAPPESSGPLTPLPKERLTEEPGRPAVPPPESPRYEVSSHGPAELPPYPRAQIVHPPEEYVWDRPPLPEEVGPTPRPPTPPTPPPVIPPLRVPSPPIWYSTA